MGATTITTARTAGQVLRAQPNGFVRAQAVYVNPRPARSPWSRPMPSQVVEQLRQQFYASLGITDATPVPEEQVPALIDAWEQYLYASAQRAEDTARISPRRRRARSERRSMPPASRIQGQPGQLVNIGGGTYVVPPLPGSVVAAPRAGTTGTTGGPIVSAAHGGDAAAARGSQPSRGTTTQGHPPLTLAGGIMAFFTVDNVVVGSGASPSAPARVSDWSSTGQYSDGAIVVFNGSQYVANGSPVVGVQPPIEVVSPVVAGSPKWTMAAQGRSRAVTYDDARHLLRRSGRHVSGGTYILTLRRCRRAPSRTATNDGRAYPRR